MSNKLLEIIEYLRNKLEIYVDSVFLFEDGFLKATEDRENIYIEFADTKEMAENNLYEDSACYEKDFSVEQIIGFIVEDFGIA